jgi:heptosyltransferase-1
VHIAIIRLSALGDIVNSLFILDFIKEVYPDATIDWITEEAFAPLLEQHPLIDNVRTVALKRAKKERSLTVLKETIASLRSLPRYDRVIDLQGLIKSAVIGKFTGSDVHGFDRESLREGLAAWFYKSHSHILYRENAMLRTAKIVSDALSLEITRETLLAKKPAFGLHSLKPELRELMDGSEPNIVFTLGSSWPSKVYPKEHFAELAAMLEGNIILVWGSPEEQQMAAYIRERVPRCSIAPKLSIYELLQLISHADLTIGNDSGPTHMAWAQNRPSITLFGPTPAYKMMFQTPINVAIESDSEIDPMKLDREDFSITTIAPETIAETAKKLLEASRSR